MITQTNHGSRIPLPPKIVHHHTCALMQPATGSIYMDYDGPTFDWHHAMSIKCTCGAERK